MSPTWPSFSSAPPAATPPRLLESWQQVHDVLTGQHRAARLPADYFSLGIYHYCVYKAFGRAPDAALAQCVWEHLLATLSLPGPPPGGWSAQQLDQFGQAAWLHTHLAADGLVPPQAPAPLLALDHTLRHAAQALRAHEAVGSYHNFFRVVRYFSLRQPGPAAQAHLQALLVAPLPRAGAVWPRPAAPPEALALGLVEGLAATLLLLSRLTRLGVPGLDLRAGVRQGVQRLLALRQPVDFAEQCYSVFPYQVHSTTGAANYSAELSWRRGDLGPAILLYEAQELLQDAELANIAELVGLNTLLRTTVPATLVTSSRLGHGAAGVAHLYHKLAQASGQHPAYRQGHSFWLAQTQSWLHQELATGFYEHRECELLEGLAGVGLVLLSAVSATPLHWDTVVL